MISKEFEKYIKEIDDNKVEEYDETFSSGDIIGGVRFKKFVRFDSEVFKELVDEIKNNPNCSYDTYVNELIKSGYIPKHISVLKKEDNSFRNADDMYEIGHFKEVIASRILNFFECPTTYEVLLNIGRQTFSCSVDFGRYREDFYQMSRIPLIHSLGLNSMDENVKDLRVKLKYFTSHNNIDKHAEEMSKKFIEDYIYSMMIRKFVLCDDDCGFHNVGLIYNVEKNTVRMAPSFDFEYCFIFAKDDHERRKEFAEFEEDLKFVKVNYPHIFSKFTTKLRQIMAKKNEVTMLSKIVENEIGKDKKSKKFSSALEDYEDKLLLITESVVKKDKII